jgi:hypothetical protein
MDEFFDQVLKEESGEKTPEGKKPDAIDKVIAFLIRFYPLILVAIVLVLGLSISSVGTFVFGILGLFFLGLISLNALVLFIAEQLLGLEDVTFKRTFLYALMISAVTYFLATHMYLILTIGVSGLFNQVLFVFALKGAVDIRKAFFLNLIVLMLDVAYLTIIPLFILSLVTPV